MKKATLQTDGSWKIEDFTSQEETDHNAMVEHGKALKESIVAAAIKKDADDGSDGIVISCGFNSCSPCK